MHASTQQPYAALVAALVVGVTLLAAGAGYSTEVIFNDLHYFSEGEEWFVTYGGDTFRVAPKAIAVRFRDGVSQAAVDSILVAADVTRMRSDQRRFHYLRLPEEADVLQTAMSMSELPRVELAETGFEIKFLSTPNDERFDYQWYLHNTGTVRGDTAATADADIDAPEAWDIETGDTTAVIAIIDTGIDKAHSDLSLSLWQNWDEVSGTSGVDDDDNEYVDDFWGWNFNEDDNDPGSRPGLQGDHGTHVAGVAAATSNNTGGIAGLAGGWGGTPRRLCRLMAIRCGRATEDSLDISAAIDYAADNGARVVNMSWATAPSENVSEALSSAYDSGTLLVAATGRKEYGSWPAEHSDVMGVSATDWNDEWGSYYGGTEIWAPGSEDVAHGYSRIYTTDTTTVSLHTYVYTAGTSLAAPQVAAIGGLLFSKNPGLTAAECRELILAGADSIGLTGSITVCRANARGALDALCDESRVDPHLSSVSVSDSSCIVLCPASDLDTLVVAIDLRTGCGDPIASVPADSITVTLIRNRGCNFRLCCGSSEFEVHADAATDTNGHTTATITAGAGVDPAVRIRATALGALIDDQPIVDLLSVAYEGTCTVPLPQPGQVPDLDCDGTAGDSDDIALVQAHYMDKCPSRIGSADDSASHGADPSSLTASRPYPNPFSLVTAIEYALPNETDLAIRVYNLSGQVVAELERGRRVPGPHVTVWDGTDGAGNHVGAGVYFIRVLASEGEIARKVVVLR